MHLYMTEIIEAMGLKYALDRVGPHPLGVDPIAWRETVVDMAVAAVECAEADVAMARDMIMVTDLLVAEMVRYPQLVHWDSKFYADAAYRGVDPDEIADEIDGVIPPSAEDIFIANFLENLLADGGQHV